MISKRVALEWARKMEVPTAKVSMFADLWERLNGNWLFNPWVMVVEFGL